MGDTTSDKYQAARDQNQMLLNELRLFLAGDPNAIAAWLLTNRSEIAGEIAATILAAQQRQRMRAHAVTAATVTDDFMIIN